MYDTVFAQLNSGADLVGGRRVDVEPAQLAAEIEAITAHRRCTSRIHEGRCGCGDCKARRKKA